MEPTATTFFPLPGQVGNAHEVRSMKAQELIAGLQNNLFPLLSLVEYRRTEQRDIIVFDIQPEVPQHPVHLIHAYERMAAVFNYADGLPTTMVLRRDFPQVPHVSFSRPDEPLQICLTEESPADQLRTWTAAHYVQLLHRWLRLTARGELHQADQPLEPVFLGSANRIILPAEFYETASSPKWGKLGVYVGSNTDNQMTYVAVLTESKYAPVDSKPANFICFTYTAKPRPQNSSRLRPGTLAELHNSLDGDDLIGTLRTHLLALQHEHPDLLHHHSLIFIRVPKTRQLGGPVETIENWVFGARQSGKEIGESIGIWQLFEGTLASLVPIDYSKSGADVELEALIPTPALTPELAAWLNNASLSSDKHYLGVGMGALGSQLINNLVRAGMHQWTLIDEDVLLGHNLARHYLPGYFLGANKAFALASLLNSIYDTGSIKPVATDVLGQPLNTYTNEALDAIIDLAASVAVGRYLAYDDTVTARRLSLFLNPSGSDLVMLAEPEDRSIRLDWLEMEYYQAVVQDTELHQHLLRTGEPVRYSYACRDVSSQLPQDQVALHAAVGARAIRSALASSEATIKIWQSAPDLTVTAIPLLPVHYTEFKLNGWILSISARVVKTMHEQRLSRLPNETGGVLIGAIDVHRKRMYVVESIPSPPDSQEWPTAYIRGIAGLGEQLASIAARTINQLGYLGEWHSHPAGCSVRPSTDDQILFAWLRMHRQNEGLPPLMAIVGDEPSIGWYVEKLPPDQGL